MLYSLGSGQESGWGLGLEPAPPSSLSLGGIWKPWPWTRDPLDWHLVWGSLKGGWVPPETKLRDTFSAPLPACGVSRGFLSPRGPSLSEPVWAAVNPGCHIACTRICPLLDPSWVHWQVWGLFPWWLLGCRARRPAPAPAVVPALHPLPRQRQTCRLRASGQLLGMQPAGSCPAPSSVGSQHSLKPALGILWASASHLLCPCPPVPHSCGLCVYVHGCAPL